MEIGVIGPLGALVRLHVGAEVKLELVCAAILHHSTMDIIAQLMVQLIARSKVVIRHLAVSFKMSIKVKQIKIKYFDTCVYFINNTLITSQL
jgi:hypothetical protein